MKLTFILFIYIVLYYKILYVIKYNYVIYIYIYINKQILRNSKPKIMHKERLNQVTGAISVDVLPKDKTELPIPFA